jgi:hypothetical protein
MAKYHINILIRTQSKHLEEISGEAKAHPKHIDVEEDHCSLMSHVSKDITEGQHGLQLLVSGGMLW